MKKLWLVSTALVVALNMSAQTETFDISSYVLPQGWSRSETNGILLLQTRRTLLGRTEFCQIYLFPSRASQGDAAQNFDADWRTLIGGLGITGSASPQREQTPDGWTVLTGSADTVRDRVRMRAILMTATGFGRAVNTMVVVSPNAYVKELEAFFQNLNFRKPGADDSTAHQSTGAADGSFAEYIFQPPDQWTRQQARGRMVLVSPTYANGERCQISMLPLQAAPSRPLGDFAVASFREIFKADPLTSYPSPPPKLVSGISPGGWEFFTIRKLVGGQEGDGKGIGTILLAAKVGNQVAMVVGVSKDFIVSNCFGELVRDVWPSFFYSLQFQNARATAEQEAAIRQKLAGSWIMATGSVGGKYTFRADGRYEGTAAARHVNAISNTEVLETTNAFFGDGSYSLNGNTMVLSGDDHTRRSFFFRVQTVSKDSGRTWADELCMLDPGASGEVCYRKQ